MAEPSKNPNASSSATCFSSSLPIAALRGRIVEKILENRVTLIVGDTGCGKSSQVPQFLLEENIQPILCTQPRRFAVVAIAKMVAEARNCEVGDEVGYHIGHSHVASPSSKIVFKTAGVLLEQMRDKGLAALKYKVIILDEVHERSVESDLVLACIKQYMMKNNSLRVVLMSATADISRFKNYFKDIGRGRVERVEVLAVPHVSRHTIFQHKVFYLEEILQLVDVNQDSSVKDYSAFGSFMDADISTEVHALIHKLILHIHKNEPDIEKSILVFLPTYFALEQQWLLLKPEEATFKVHILHRSIDTEHALSAMRICKSHRKVILATNIAESSVTIPGVAFVIDSCRSLQVFWDHNRSTDATQLVWVSKSQAEQRKGRTGRTCDGQIYRLVTGIFYNSFNDHEHPAILRLSLRGQVLTVCCADSKAINDPKFLLQRVMDPPSIDIIEDALSLLVHIQALERSTSHRGRHEPTFYGYLLDSLPLSFEASILVLKFGEIGMLREGIFIAILMDIQPLPITQPFGQPDLFVQHLESYFEEDKAIGRKENILMANLCAFQFWERTFKDKHRLCNLKQILEHGKLNFLSTSISKLEEEWCYLHKLVPAALNNIADIYDNVMRTLHRFRPQLLHTVDCLSSYYLLYDFKHICIHECESCDVALSKENPELVTESKLCVALPYVATSDFQATRVAENLAKLVKEVRVQCTEGGYQDLGQNADFSMNYSNEAVLCKYFLNGSCSRGDECFFSHSLNGRRPECKFYFTMQGCRYGSSCFFSHDHVSPIQLRTRTGVCPPEVETASPDLFLQLLPSSTGGFTLILGDRHLHFTSKLSDYVDPAKIISCQPPLHSSESNTSISFIEFLDVLEPCHSAIETNRTYIPWAKVHCILLFVEFEDDEEVHHLHLGRIFERLACKILAENLCNPQIVITMNNIRFTQLQVEKLARECFFFLNKSFPFDVSTFGELSDVITHQRPMQASLPVSYVFGMLLPAEVTQVGENPTSVSWPH